MVPVVKKSLRSISIIIPSWNGKHLLKRFLPSVIEACETYEGETEIIVVDDGSTDGSEESVRFEFPEVKLICLKENRGFIDACNIGVNQSINDIVVLLNNDVEVERDFLTHIQFHFADTNVFAVRLSISFLPDRNGYYGGMIWCKFKLGLLYLFDYPSKDNQIVKECLYAGGGAFAVDKSKFLMLEGFDPLFSPFYWEDFDLCYRARKRGWKILYEPRSKVYHLRHSTIGPSFKKRIISCIIRRNHYIFLWKNINSFELLLYHILCMPVRILLETLSGRVYLICSLLSAFKKLKDIRKKRKEEIQHASVLDEAIIFRFREER